MGANYSEDSITRWSPAMTPADTLADFVADCLERFAALALTH
jgi:hypothetical protein